MHLQEIELLSQCQWDEDQRGKMCKRHESENFFRETLTFSFPEFAADIKIPNGNLKKNC